MWLGLCFFRWVPLKISWLEYEINLQWAVHLQFSNEKTWVHYQSIYHLCLKMDNFDLRCSKLPHQINGHFQYGFWYTSTLFTSDLHHIRESFTNQPITSVRQGSLYYYKPKQCTIKVLKENPSTFTIDVHYSLIHSKKLGNLMTPTESWVHLHQVGSTQNWVPFNDPMAPCVQTAHWDLETN